MKRFICLLGMALWSGAALAQGAVGSPTLETNNVLVIPKLSGAPGAGPGAGKVAIFAIAGTGAGSCKIMAQAGTDATPVLITDNIGSGC